MHRAVLFGLVLVFGAAAGCLGDGGDGVPPEPAGDALGPALTARIGDGPSTLLPARFQLPAVEGDRLGEGPPMDWMFGASECDDEPACVRVLLSVDVPEGYWRTEPGTFEINIRAAPGDAAGTMATRLLDPEGNLVERGIGGKYSQLFLLQAFAGGDYLLELWAYDGVVNAEVYLGIEPPAPDPPAETIDLLPDLIMLPPLDLKVDLPYWSNTLDGVPYPAPLRMATQAATPGCTPDEATEGGSLRCLRVSTGVGNIGAGPLEVRMPSDDPLAPWVTPGGYLQRVHRSDGSTYDRDAGSEGTFHLSHAHLHYPNLVKLQVFEYDNDTGTRGAEVGKGSKTGFCLVSEGLVDVGMDGSSFPRWPDEGTCFNTPGSRVDWAMGVWPQWFDMYETYRSGQHAEISGVPDGTYVFVVTADPEDSILESDETNNENSVVFRLTGNEVEILGPEA